MYAPLAVANSIIERAPSARRPIDLNHLVFIFHGWSLAVGQNLVNEQPKVAVDGPIYPSFSQHLKSFRGGAVSALFLTALDWSSRIGPNDTFANDLLAKVVATYGCLTSEQLATYSKSSLSPWAEAKKGAPEHMLCEISPGYMEAYYQERMVYGHPTPRQQDMIIDLAEMFPIRPLDKLNEAAELVPLRKIA